MTRLCVPIFVRDIAQATRDIATAIEGGADIVELRIDALRIDAVSPKDLPAVESLRQVVRTAGVPCIITCRPTSEGGESELDAEARLVLVGVTDAAYIDIELETIYGRTGRDIP